MRECIVFYKTIIFKILVMSEYKVPSWAGKPPAGFHLDVIKDEKLIQKLMIDEKGSYMFGRNSQLNDFTVDHNSCSRVHAALLYHTALKRFFLVDCGSTHGTYIGNVRIEEHKPTQLATNMKFHFGASTRSYLIRERPQTGIRIIPQNTNGLHIPYSETTASASKITFTELPKSEIEIDNITEYNTARNRQSSNCDITECDRISVCQKKKVNVSFQETEEIINPEDIDPNVGRFQNMIETQFIPNKTSTKLEPIHVNHSNKSLSEKSTTKHFNLLESKPICNDSKGLYESIESTSDNVGPSLASTSLSTKLGFFLPNPAPYVENQTESSEATKEFYYDSLHESKKKKYPIEAWPGRSKFLHSNM